MRGRIALTLTALALSACVDSATQYRSYAAQVVAQGGLRTVTAAPDAAFDDADLARNFERIAFFSEGKCAFMLILG